MGSMFLHKLPDVQQLFDSIGQEIKVLPLLVEKDYWLMHSLWGLKQQGFNFELKGGTSLSKGFNIIKRFSEDIDIHIHPDTTEDVKIGKNHDKESHIQSRRLFFDKLAQKITIPDLIFEREPSFDDKEKMRNAGIVAKYSSFFSSLPDIKPVVLLEVGFDQTTPHLLTTITSWAYEKAKALNLDIIDNRAIDIKCYCPEYTFVEKLSAISCKFRNQQQMGTFPVNFLRHYYDVYQLLTHDRVLNFIGTDDYYEHKGKRFRPSDEKNLKKNDAFIFPNEETKKLYKEKYQEKASLYYEEQPSFDKILDRILIYINKL